MTENTETAFLNPAQKASLKFSGYAYLLADAAIFAYGCAKREYGSAITGLSWAAGGLVPALYGKQSPEYKLKRLTQDLGHYLEDKGYSLPAESEIERERKSSYRLQENAERFLYDNPSEILNATYGLGSLGVTFSGLKKRDPWQTASGLFVAAGALSGLLIQEKAPPEQQPEPTLFSDPVSWAQEKPLRVSGTLYTLNNVSLAKSGWDEMRANPADKSYLLKYLAVGSYVTANKLLADSHKDRDKDAPEIDLTPLEHAAADIIAAQPKALHRKAIHDISGFLASQPNVSVSEAELATALSQRVDKLTRPAPVQVAEHKGRLDEPVQRAMSNE